MCQTKPALLRSRALWLHHMLSVVSDDKHFEMQTFVQKQHGGPSASFIGVTSSWPWCSTAGCIGGHIIMLGYTPEERSSSEIRNESFTKVAADWLGLDHSYAASNLTGSMFSPGFALGKVTRQHAIDAVHNLYEDGVWHWKAVSGMADFDYADWLMDPGDRGDPLHVKWRTEPDRIVGDLFTLRDRIKRAYWNGIGEQPWPNSLEGDTPVCLLTGAGAVTRDMSARSAADELLAALRLATPSDGNFVTVSDSGLDNAVALIDKAILIRLGVLPALRPDLG